VLNLSEQVAKICVNLEGEGIETVRPIKRNDADAAGGGEAEVFPLGGEFGRRTKRAH
jgi:hypothetical protein